MSDSLHKAGFSFGSAAPKKSYDYVTRIGGNRFGGIFCYLDIEVPEQAAQTHKSGDLIINCLGDEMRFYRVGEDRQTTQMTVNTGEIDPEI